MKNKLVPILTFLISIELFFWLNGFTSTAFWYQLGRFGLNYKSTFLLTFGTLSWIFFLITVVTAGYIMHNRILRMKAFALLTLIAFYLGGFGFWLSGFIPAVKSGTDFSNVFCLPTYKNSICLGLPTNLFAPFVYLNIVVGLVLVFILLRKEKVF